MKLRTVAVVVGLCLLLGGVVVYGVAATGGSLEEAWVSDTPRENERNHHPVGVGPNGSVLVAPVAEVPRSGGTLSADACSLVRLGPGDGGVRWRVPVPPERCFSHALTGPAVADLDGDGALEVTVGSTQEAVVVYDAADGSERWRVDTPTYGYGVPAVADLLPATGREVVASDIAGNVVAVHANGSVAWRTALEGTLWESVSVYASPRVADLDGDDRLEVLVGSNRGTAVLGADGRVAWHRNETATYVATARLDGESSATVFTSAHDGIRAYDGADGALVWQRDLTNARVASTVTVDGRTLLLAGVLGGDVVALEAATGEVAWRTTLVDGDVTVAPPIVADVTGDGTPEVVAASTDGTVGVLDAADGAERAAYERSVPVWVTPTPADLDGDGSAELLVMYGDGRVVALDYTSALLGEFR